MGIRDVVADPAATVKYVIKYNNVAREPVEHERLEMALRDNVVTNYVSRNGIGGIDRARFQRAIKQLGQSYTFTCKSVRLAKLLDSALETGTVDPADSVSGDIICNDIVSQGHFKPFMLNGFTCNIVVFDYVFDRCCRISDHIADSHQGCIEEASSMQP